MDGREEKRWPTSRRTSYPAVNGTSRREMDATPSRLTVKAVTAANCLDSGTNASVACERKDLLYRVDCLATGHGDIYRVEIRDAGQANEFFPSFSGHLSPHE